MPLFAHVILAHKLTFSSQLIPVKLSAHSHSKVVALSPDIVEFTTIQVPLFL